MKDQIDLIREEIEALEMELFPELFSSDKVVESSTAEEDKDAA